MENISHRLLDLSRMEVLRRVRLRPRGAAEGTFAGPHTSNYRGTAVEFTDYREYVEGDDIRLVDWKVFARSDRYYVRLYEAERNLLSYLVVDTSGSMDFAGAVVRTASKLEFACRLAAALGYLVVRESDQVGLSLAHTRVHEHLPPRGSWTHLRAALDILGSARADGRTDLGSCLDEVHGRISRRGVLIVLSDFLDSSPTLWKSIDLFRRARFDVMLFHVVHPEEMDLPDVAAARFLDAEGPDVFLAEPDDLRDAYRRRFAEFVSEVQGGARVRGCDWYLARTDTDPYVFLKRCFLARQVSR